MRLAQHVAAAPDGFDEVAALGSVGELLAQLADEDVDDLQFGLVHAAIEMVEEHFLGEGGALAEREQLQHLVFLARQMHALAADLDRLGVEIDHEIAGLDHRLGVALGAAPNRMDARTQFGLGEGLGHVVVGADAEALDLVLDAGEAGEDQNGGLDLRHPKLLQHVVTGHVGQIEVEKDNCVIVKLTEIAAFFPEIRRIDVKTLGFEHQLNRLRDGAVIFYQQNAHASPLSSPLRASGRPHLRHSKRLWTTDSNPDDIWLTKSDSRPQALSVQFLTNRPKILRRSRFLYPFSFKFHFKRRAQPTPTTRPSSEQSSALSHQRQ